MAAMQITKEELDKLSNDKVAKFAVFLVNECFAAQADGLEDMEIGRALTLAKGVFCSIRSSTEPGDNVREEFERLMKEAMQ
jgi:hypothetical protein